MLLVVTTYLFSKVTGASKLISVGAAYVLLSVLIFSSRGFIVDVGLSKSNLLSGIKLAIPLMLAIILGVALVFLFKPTIFQDARYQGDVQTLLVTVFITIPFFTVLLEELAFRGLLLGGLLSMMQPLWANVVSSLGFGVWHVFSAQSLRVPEAVPQPVVIIGVVAATAVAGLFFGWLRLHSGSLVAPILVHWCINSAGAVAAFFAWRLDT
jgi:membrane protease YdiL (CAAX protease family)